MNKFILVAMNRKNHTQEELDENRDAAYAAYAAYVVYAAYAAAAYAAASVDASAEYWINKYFERTGEDRQLYTNEIERINNMKTVMDAVNKSTKELEVMDRVSCYVCHVGACPMQQYCGSCGHELLSELTLKAQPVFTQDMADNGELPLVGSKCDFETTFFTAATSNKGTCEILAYHGGKVWINTIDFDCVINLNVIDFKPIDTRTDKEKAADEFIKDMTDSDFIKEQFKKTFLAGAEWAGE